MHKYSRSAAVEKRTARLTILIDPAKKQIFEEICAANDLTPSQVVRRLVRQYIVDHAGSRELPAWLQPGQKPDKTAE
jgi:hypothetical protein